MPSLGQKLHCHLTSTSPHPSRPCPLPALIPGYICPLVYVSSTRNTSVQSALPSTSTQRVSLNGLRSSMPSSSMGAPEERMQSRADSINAVSTSSNHRSSCYRPVGSIWARASGDGEKKAGHGAEFSAFSIQLQRNDLNDSYYRQLPSCRPEVT